MEPRVSFDSPYYPYEKVGTYNTLKGSEYIPLKLIKYLLDLPDQYGYEPVDDNRRPRVRLAKYLYYDCPNPLAMPLPTPEQKLSMLYDGNDPMATSITDGDTAVDADKHPVGYRLMAQCYTMPSETEARVLMKCNMGRMIPRSPYDTSLGINFEVTINYAMDNVMKTQEYSRSYSIVQCIIEALHGIDIAGVGTVMFYKSLHGDAGTEFYHTEGTSILTMCLMWSESQPDMLEVHEEY